MSHQPSSNTGADIELKSITDTFGRFRVTADATYMMTPSPTPTLSTAPITLGYNNFTLGGTTLWSTTVGGTSVSISGYLIAGGQIQINLNITASGATSGNFNVNWSYISDNEVYNNPGPTRVYPAPIGYLPAHKQGSILFV
jgi:hypothetical protein